MHALPDSGIELTDLRAAGREKLWAIVSDPVRLEKYLAMLDYGLTRESGRSTRREAMRAYFAAIAMCGIERQTVIANEIYMRIGARDESEARRAITILQDAEGKNIDEQVEDACRWLARVLGERTDLRARAAEWLAPALSAVPQLPPHANGSAT